jgi:hypothetical protein
VSARDEGDEVDVGEEVVEVGVSSSSVEEVVVSWARAGERRRSTPKRKGQRVSSCIVAAR